MLSPVGMNELSGGLLAREFLLMYASSSGEYQQETAKEQLNGLENWFGGLN